MTSGITSAASPHPAPVNAPRPPEPRDRPAASHKPQATSRQPPAYPYTSSVADQPRSSVAKKPFHASVAVGAV